MGRRLIGHRHVGGRVRYQASITLRLASKLFILSDLDFLRRLNTVGEPVSREAIRPLDLIVGT